MPPSAAVTSPSAFPETPPLAAGTVTSASSVKTMPPSLTISVPAGNVTGEVPVLAKLMPPLAGRSGTRLTGRR
ncbi:MAG: hypothetical protein R2845_00630 [Thermomicrobiales bacterium]